METAYLTSKQIRESSPLYGDAKLRKEAYDATKKRAEETGMKICTVCKEDKPVGEFYTYVRKSGKGRIRYCYSRCKTCHYGKTTAWNEKNPEKRRAYSRSTKAKRNYSGVKLGVTPEMFEAMTHEQNHLCAICNQPQNAKNSTRLYIDHDHSNSKVRALLCDACNNMLGRAKDNPTTLRRAAAYIEKYREIHALEDMVNI